MKTYYKTNRLRIGDGEAQAQCDRTGFICRKKDLVKQMEYNGTGLYWTGLYVLKDFVTKPNPAFLIPPMFQDPRPVLDTKVPYPEQIKVVEPAPVPIYPYTQKNNEDE